MSLESYCKLGTCVLITQISCCIKCNISIEDSFKKNNFSYIKKVVFAYVCLQLKYLQDVRWNRAVVFCYALFETAQAKASSPSLSFFRWCFLLSRMSLGFLRRVYRRSQRMRTRSFARGSEEQTGDKKKLKSVCN